MTSTPATGSRPDVATAGVNSARGGVLPAQRLRAAIAQEWVLAGEWRIPSKSVQPASIDLRDGATLERDRPYLVPLVEELRLPDGVRAKANPKSSTGRLDVFARVITDYGTEFDRIREGYKGPLFAEISPRAFSILVRTGSRLVQLRIRRGSPLFRDTALRRLHAEERIYLHPWTGPLCELPQPPLALLVGHEIAYYASARGN